MGHVVHLVKKRLRLLSTAKEANSIKTGSPHCSRKEVSKEEEREPRSATVCCMGKAPGKTHVEEGGMAECMPNHVAHAPHQPSSQESHFGIFPS